LLARVWEQLSTWLLADGHVEDAALLLTYAHAERLQQLRDRLELAE